ncbi:hypothetical protein P4O66_019126 [Electrophorus voltai]|uniref:Protein kinase domain-containing protein n=1 Tax=Electrophorus voltai TaxID=2609070 RepID=A0AAD8ZWU5_9TELE|nr:hypothetical protein P4O66_019126 [Electrophorus voltai]
MNTYSKQPLNQGLLNEALPDFKPLPSVEADGSPSGFTPPVEVEGSPSGFTLLCRLKVINLGSPSYAGLHSFKLHFDWLAYWQNQSGLLSSETKQITDIIQSIRILIQNQAAIRLLNELCHLTAQSLTSLDPSDHYRVIKLLGEGSYGKVILAVHKKRGTLMALKFFPRDSTSLLSFLREYNLSLAFCTHPSLTSALGIVFSTPNHYVFAQQPGLYGDLYDVIIPEVSQGEKARENERKKERKRKREKECHITAPSAVVPSQKEREKELTQEMGLAETCVQRVASQISGALSHLHSLGFVHRDVKPENIFLCDRDCRWVKLGDFGMVKAVGTRVPCVWYSSPYCTPEAEIARKKEETESGSSSADNNGNKRQKKAQKEQSKCVLVSVEASTDSWALGILIYAMLMGRLPWAESILDNVAYKEYLGWREQERTLTETKGLYGIKDGRQVAQQFRAFTPLACSLFQAFLHPEPKFRATPEKVPGFLGEAWLLSADISG